MPKVIFFCTSRQLTEPEVSSFYQVNVDISVISAAIIRSFDKIHLNQDLTVKMPKPPGLGPMLVLNYRGGQSHSNHWHI